MRKILFAISIFCALNSIGTVAFAQQCRVGGAVNPTNQCGARLGASVDTLRNIASINGCKFRCDGNRFCRAWTYVIAEKDCYLHQIVDPVVDNNCCATGVRF